MALINNIFPGFSGKVYIQPGTASVVPLTQANLGSQTLVGATTASASLTAIITANNWLQVQEIGDYGYQPASTNIPLAGARFSQSIITQSAAQAMEWTFSWNPASTTYQLLDQDAVNVTARTFVLVGTANNNVVYWATNCYTSAIKLNYSTGDVAKATAQIVPIGGGLFGYSFV
jgi:hypothetical protein